MTGRVVATLLVEKPCLVRRPWWKFWGQDTLGTTHDWVCMEIEDLTSKQLHLMHSMYLDPDLRELLEHLLAHGNKDKVVNIDFFGLDQPAPERKPPQFTPWRPRT